jgi:hypothetical protein
MPSEVLRIEDEATYRSVRSKVDAYQAAMDRKFPKQYSFTQAEIQSLGVPSPSNTERSAVEEWEFRRDAPARYFAYVSSDGQSITTWTGQVLGRVLSMGDGRKVRSLEVQAINGCRYVGTYHCGDGDYCRLRRAD